ncbi:MAG: hypothetical protein AB1679_02790 [Actinomycetota bacterium]
MVAAVAGWGPTMPRASAELDASSQWAASARADAMAIEYLNTNAPVFGAEPIIYGTPASAASLVDSVGQSYGWAAAPYPGDIMVGAADNGNGALVGAGLPGIFQSYPFYVRSEYPIAQNKVQDQSGNRLTANSEQYKSSSEARSGLITGDFLAALQAQASSLSSVDPNTGELTALADSRLDAFRFTDKLQIGKSTAHAKVTRLPGQELKKESSFTLGSIVVNGVEMSYGDEGFKFADQKGESPGDPQPLFDALKAAGITVEILPARGTETSIESAGMKITQVTDYGAGQQRISLIIGRVSAAVSGEAKPVSDSLLGDLTGTEPTDTGSGSASYGTDTTSADAALGGEEIVESIPEPVEAAAGLDLTLSTPAVTPPDLSLPAVSGSGDGATVPPVVAAVNPGAGARAQAAPPEVRLASPASVGKGLRDDDISGFYLGLGALAALLTVAAFVLRGGGRAAKAAAAGSVLKLPS